MSGEHRLLPTLLVACHNHAARPVHETSSSMEGCKVTLFPAKYDFLNQQHAQISALIDSLQDALDQDDAKLFRQLLGQIKVAERAHFAEEEAAMLATDYPDLATHRNQHKATMADFDAVMVLFDESSLTAIGDRVARHLRNWLDENMLMDKPFAEFLAQGAT